MDRSYYSGRIHEFLAADPAAVLASLENRSRQEGLEPTDAQISAWQQEIDLLRSWLRALKGSIYIEYSIPRMGLRADVILLVGPVLFVLEFKVESAEYTREARSQAWDYALDLKNFHEPSHTLPIVPIVVATAANDPLVRVPLEFASDSVAEPLLANSTSVPEAIQAVLEQVTGAEIDWAVWERGRYLPTPTIIEAARALYNEHSVSEISRSDAGAFNITDTSKTLQVIIETAKAENRKAICFVTGVPGSGKTLVGLNVATMNRGRDSNFYSVYLSGNGPLVKVLSEALVRDKHRRLRSRKQQSSLYRWRSEVKAFIQNIHNFRDEYVKDRVNPPAEHVAIFDEAQRAWTKDQTAKFMSRRKGIADWSKSEPDYLINYMNRHPDWAVVICLVGGGQEIHTGEAGISEWFRALTDEYRDWSIYSSDELTDSEYSASDQLQSLKGSGRLTPTPKLHLSTSLRSFRADCVSRLVKAVLDVDREGSINALRQASRYPIVLTRQLPGAKDWLRKQSRGTERMGMVVSASAERLKPLAIDVRSPVDPVHWFLDEPDDTRSSNFLEDAATEFQVQGLEVDWAGVTWDADLRFNGRSWEHWSFAGNQWKQVRKAERRRYLLNAYRVLLTRARQGMVIVVPEGDANDPTRLPSFYDPTFDYLRGLGIPLLT